MKAHFFDKVGNFVMTKELSDYNGIPIWREARMPKDILPFVNKTLPDFVPDILPCDIIEYREVCTLYNGSIIFEQRWD